MVGNCGKQFATLLLPSGYLIQRQGDRAMRLTAKTIDALKLPEGKADHTYWDEGLTGFGLRIRESGARKFIFWYRAGSQQRRISLGPATRETVELARKNAADLAAKVHLG